MAAKTIEQEDASPSIAQASKMRKFSQDGKLDGNVVEIDGQLYCSPEYTKMISNTEVVYYNDIATDSEDVYEVNILAPDTEFIY